MDVCRICYIEEDKNNPLIAPCECKGSVQYIHKRCLYTWIRISLRNTCELCKTIFKMELIKFEKVYRPNLYFLQLSTRPDLIFVELLSLYFLYLQYTLSYTREASYSKYQHIYNIITRVQEQIPTLLGIVLACQGVVLVPAFQMIQQKCRYLSYIFLCRDISGMTAYPLTYYFIISCSILISFYYSI